MIALEILTWWYRRGWAQVAANSEQRFVKVSHMFSVPILIRTWFAPWRRIVTYPGASIEAKFRAATDNLVSRVVGFTVRTMVLISAGVMLLLTAVVAGLQLIVWPLIPPGVIILLVKGITG
jgi:hypothetical protein